MNKSPWRPAWTWRDTLLVGLAAGAAALPFALLIAMLATIRAYPADLGQWFDGLKNKQGDLCCSVSDGLTLRNPDWDTKGGHYRVRIGGKWIVVPDGAVVTVPNKFGAAVVWPIIPGDGSPTTIRCFMPGAGA